MSLHFTAFVFTAFYQLSVKFDWCEKGGSKKFFTNVINGNM